MPMPSIPTELLYDIIDTTWASHHAPDQRIHTLRTFRLISKTWTAVFDPISLTDVHVPCTSFYYHLFNDATGDLSRCQRITFTVSSEDGLSSSRLSPFNLESMTRFDMIKLTSLHTMNIVYYEKSFPDPYNEDFFLALPHFLPTLTISYTFSPHTPLSLINDLRRQFQHQSKPRYASPRVGTLEINGASEFIAAVWESLFPNRERLIRDGKEEKQRMIPVSSYYDPIHGIPFLLKNWQREQEFINAHSPTTSKSHRFCSSPSTLSNEDGWVFPRPPDVTRSPTDTSAATMTSTTSQKRRRKMGSQEDPVKFKHIEGYGVQLLVTNYLSVEPLFSAIAQSSVPLGEVGYINKESGTFSRLFNAFEPHCMQGFTIPSMHGYGEVQVHSVKYRHQLLPGAAAAPGLSLITPDVSHKPSDAKEMAGISKVRRAVGLRSWFKTRETAEFRYIDSSSSSSSSSSSKKKKDKGVAETWLEANLDKVVALYGHLLGVSRENLALVTGIVAC